jgi:hypothetical protein
MRAGRKSYGYILSFPSPWVIDILGKLDFDSVFIDGEHGPFDLVQLELPTYANGTPIPTVDVHQPGDTENKSGVFACAAIAARRGSSPRWVSGCGRRDYAIRYTAVSNS